MQLRQPDLQTRQRSERAMAKVVQLATVAAVLQIAGPVCALALTEPDCTVKEGKR